MHCSRLVIFDFKESSVSHASAIASHVTFEMFISKAFGLGLSYVVDLNKTQPCVQNCYSEMNHIIKSESKEV